jgi:hypothetical protein
MTHYLDFEYLAYMLKHNRMVVISETAGNVRCCMKPATP